jgi:homopolymeric O-antigen transport system permease protein
VAVYTDVLRFRELFLHLFRRDLEVRYRGSALGLLWTLINPLILMLAYTLIFSILLKAESIEYYPLFVLAGLLPWAFFSASLQTATTTLVGHSNLVKQVRFPRQLLPFSVLGTNLVTFFVMLVVILPFTLVLIPATRATFWAALPMVVPLVALTAGFALVVACANVMFRDVEHLVAAVLLPWFFLTPIFYTFDTLPGLQGREWIGDVLYYANVFVPVLETIRDPLFFGEWPRATDIAYAVTVATASLVIGAVVFRRIDDHLAAEL